MNQLEINTRIQVAKRRDEVFESIVDPGKMANYFISWGSGNMEEGKIIQWKFAEFEETFNVRIGEIRKPVFISFYWEIEKQEMKVEIKLEEISESSTLVSVSESGKECDDAGIAWLKGNTEGWANFLACLKAYLEYGINLRQGAFDFLKR